MSQRPPVVLADRTEVPFDLDRLTELDHETNAEILETGRRFAEAIRTRRRPAPPTRGEAETVTVNLYTRFFRAPREGERKGCLRLAVWHRGARVLDRNEDLESREGCNAVWVARLSEAVRSPAFPREGVARVVVQTTNKVPAKWIDEATDLRDEGVEALRMFLRTRPGGAVALESRHCKESALRL
jgi:hypothetical protein